MGVWGTGNFDNDDAREYLDDMIRQLLGTIEKCFSAENVDEGDLEFYDTSLMTSVDLLVLLCQHYKASPLVDENVAKEWKSKYLQIYDENIDDHGAKLDYKLERRQIIERTFNDLVRVAHEYPF